MQKGTLPDDNEKRVEASIIEVYFRWKVVERRTHTFM